MDLTLASNAQHHQHNHSRPWLPPAEMAPFAPQEALLSVLAQRMDRWQPTEQADILLGAVKGVYGPQNTPILWQFIIAGVLWGPYTPSTPPKITSASSVGCKLFIQSVGVECKASCGVLGGHFWWRQPWLWRLWRKLCYVMRLLKISIKILKSVVWYNVCMYNYIL